MSRHHKNATIKIVKNAMIREEFFLLFSKSKPENIMQTAVLDATRGQGLFSTRWNGLNFSVII